MASFKLRSNHDFLWGMTVSYSLFDDISVKFFTWSVLKCL